MATLKDERLQIRVDPADKALLERAAAAAHLNVSAFVVGLEGRGDPRGTLEHPALRAGSRRVQRGARTAGGRQPATCAGSAAQARVHLA